MPPALGDPARLGAIADADADEVLGGVADPEIGPRRRGAKGQQGRDHSRGRDGATAAQAGGKDHFQTS
jgi:hypothetical protein